jgi:hypothetical protein
MRTCVIISVSFILALSSLGCKKKQRIPFQDVRSIALSPVHCEEAEAFFTDISLPLGLTGYQLKSPNNPDQHIIDYYSSFTFTTIQDFYELDMERLGWRLLSKFETMDCVLLLFDKPQTWCIVTINAYLDAPNIASKATIFVDNKALSSIS